MERVIPLKVFLSRKHSRSTRSILSGEQGFYTQMQSTHFESGLNLELVLIISLKGPQGLEKQSIHSQTNLGSTLNMWLLGEL